jgi:hypothetical protein
MLKAIQKMMVTNMMEKLMMLVMNFIQQHLQLRVQLTTTSTKKTVQSALRLKKPMTIQLEKEPDNPKDSNAIVGRSIFVKVCVDDLSL